MSKKDKEKPIWKTDFPIKQDEATHVSRREFAKFLCLLSGGLAIGNGAIAAKSLLFPKKRLDEEYFVCNSTEVPIGKMKAFVINENHKVPYILIHLGEDKWRCFEQKCTHLSCAVLYDHDQNKIVCPCHKGFFNPETGEVLQGPPPRPLPQLSVVIRDGKVYVKDKDKA